MQHEYGAIFILYIIYFIYYNRLVSLLRTMSGITVVSMTNCWFRLLLLITASNFKFIFEATSGVYGLSDMGIDGVNYTLHQCDSMPTMPGIA